MNLSSSTKRGVGVFSSCDQGFIQRGGLVRNLEIEYGYYISYLHVTEQKYMS